MNLNLNFTVEFEFTMPVEFKLVYGSECEFEFKCENVIHPRYMKNDVRLLAQVIFHPRLYAGTIFIYKSPLLCIFAHVAIGAVRTIFCSVALHNRGFVMWLSIIRTDWKNWHIVSFRIIQYTCICMEK